MYLVLYIYSIRSWNEFGGKI